jgi:histidine ammonia-lyase
MLGSLPLPGRGAGLRSSGSEGSGAATRPLYGAGTGAASARPEADSLSAVPVLLGARLYLRDVLAVARGERVALAPQAAARIDAARAVVRAKAEAGEVVYGVTTGFGSLANVRIERERTVELQHAILRSHATAVGRPLAHDEARAMLVLRAHVLALGHSGVRREVVERMIELLNLDLIPVVPERGSLGASGDLAPLAALALPLIGGGSLLVDGRPVEAAVALNRAGLEPLELVEKEGLALVNGTQGMLAVGILAGERVRGLCRAADVAAAMSVEAALGTDRAFDARLQSLRPHAGQASSAANLRRLLDGSAIIASHRSSDHLVQDAYSLRCAPQVHGATRDVLAFVSSVLEIEASSVSDNPIVLPDDGEVLSGGNFHGQPVAVALDALAVATVGTASVSERRLYRLLDPATSHGLPAFLVAESGVNSGFMLAQYTAASLVSECKSIAHPASVDSIPSSAGQEDHVSMGMIAARHARDVVEAAEIVVAIEALTAAQALDLRGPLQPAPGTRAARETVRSIAPFLDRDRELGPEIDATTRLVREGTLVQGVEAEVGALE